MNNENTDKKLKFIHIICLTEDCNKTINRAIYLANKSRCAQVNTVHAFIALMECNEIGGQLLERLGITCDDLYDNYDCIVEQGVYVAGSPNIDDAELGFFSNELRAIVTTLILRHGTMGVSRRDLFNEIMNIDDGDLDVFLDYCRISYFKLRSIMEEMVEIPQEIEDFVEDWNVKLDKHRETVCDVDEYIEEMINTLGRKNKANPCLVGDAGVGKTTIVKELVQRILDGNVPECFKNTHVVYINSALLTSGTRYRGDFEERMKIIIDWASSTNVILFLDEVHTFINLGKNSDSSSDTAGNMIKGALADGSIRIIGATTPSEFHKYIEKDAAFSRRLQKISIKEPSIKEAISMVTKSVHDYESYHDMEISDNVVKLAVTLSHKYIKDAFLPDKAYTVIDQACAKAKFKGKKELTDDDILNTISKLTSINISKLSSNELSMLMNLENTISKKIVSQEKAISTVCKAIRRSKAGVRDKDKPLATFLFVGPTGVGKTELCKVLNDEVAIGKSNIIKIDMSEYSEKNSISKLIGSAPGYVGYGEGGNLTEKVKHNPYSIILFDEIEKANDEIYNLFLQLLDEGRLTDGEGSTVDFTNCIIVMTSNAGYGADGMNKKSLGFAASNDTEKVDPRKNEKIAMKALSETFKPEFLNRLDDIVIFEKLNRDDCYKIATLLLNKLAKRLLDKNIKIKFNKSVVEFIVNNGYSDEYGARNIKRTIQTTVEDALADEILSCRLCDGCSATVSCKKDNIIVNVKDKVEA